MARKLPTYKDWLLTLAGEVVDAEDDGDDTDQNKKSKKKKKKELRDKLSRGFLKYMQISNAGDS
jgi:hypothetical protein